MATTLWNHPKKRSRCWHTEQVHPYLLGRCHHGLTRQPGVSAKFLRFSEPLGEQMVHTEHQVEIRCCEKHFLVLWEGNGNGTVEDISNIGGSSPVLNRQSSPGIGTFSCRSISSRWRACSTISSSLIATAVAVLAIAVIVRAEDWHAQHGLRCNNTSPRLRSREAALSA